MQCAHSLADSVVPDLKCRFLAAPLSTAACMPRLGKLWQLLVGPLMHQTRMHTGVTAAAGAFACQPTCPDDSKQQSVGTLHTTKQHLTHTPTLHNRRGVCFVRHQSRHSLTTQQGVVSTVSNYPTAALMLLVVGLQAWLQAFALGSLLVAQDDAAAAVAAAGCSSPPQPVSQLPTSPWSAAQHAGHY